MRVSKVRRPKPAELGPARLTAVRGPHSDGSGRWYWRARTKGTDQRTVWTGWATRDAAMSAVAALVATGAPLGTTPKATPVDTVGDLLEVWMGHQRTRTGLKASTLKHYRNQARHLVGGLRDVRLQALDRRTVERYVSDRLREQEAKRGRRAPRTVKQEVCILSMAWRFGTETGIAPDRAFPRVRVKVTGHVLNHRTPTAADVAAALTALPEQVKLVVRLLATTGARVGEVAALRCNQYDPAARILTLDGKTGERPFPLPEPLASDLARNIEGRPAGATIIDLGVQHVEQKVGRELGRACRKAGVPPFTPHGLRRLVVDRLARAGVDVGTAAALLGHSPAVMLQHYRAISDDDRLRAVAAARLGSLDGGAVVEGPWKDRSRHKS